MKLQDTLRRTMGRRGATVRELAQATGISKSTLSDWLAGTRPRDLGEVRTLARHLGVSFEYLVFGEEDSEKALDVDSLPTEVFFEGLMKVRLERVISTSKQKKEK